MKRKITLAGVLMAFAILISSCQKEEFTEEVVTQNSTTQENTINFKGLQVNHRFLTSEDELNLMTHDYQPKQLYNKLVYLAKKGSRSKGLNTITDKQVFLSKTNGEELPSLDVLIEATKKVIANFPFHEIEGYIKTEVDSMGTVNIEMIKQDFSSLTKKQVEENLKLIDEYYSKNLDYMVLNEIAENKELYQINSNLNKNTSLNKSTSDWRNECIWATVGVIYGHIRTGVAMKLAKNASNAAATRLFEDLGSYDTRRDAYKHSLNSALLAKYYWTIFPSKSWRVNFSKMVMDLNETDLCGGTPNDADGREMDYHNNKIGRDVWLSTATWDKILWINVGVSSGSETLLKNLLHFKVNRESTLIVKGKDDTNNRIDPQYQYSTSEVASMIKNQIPANRIVYFKDKIAPVYRTYHTEEDYSGCDSKGGLKGKAISPDDPCVKKIIITTRHFPKFITKDLTYDPLKIFR